MNDSELQHLIKMANQISDNLRYGDSPDTVAMRVADHLTRFWAPSMKEKIIKYSESDGGELKEPVRLAIKQLTIIHS